MLRLVLCLTLASTALGMQSLTEVAASLNETQFTSLIDQAGLASTLNSGGRPERAASASLALTRFGLSLPVVPLPFSPLSSTI